MRDDLLRVPLSGKRRARHTTCGDFGQRNTYAFRHERHCTRCARVHFEHEHVVLLDGHLHVHQSNDAELDRQLVPLLRERFTCRGNVEVVEADILSVDLPGLLGERGPAPWKVAANLPYNISSQVLIKFLETPELFSDMYLMLQKEVGDRLAAKVVGSARQLAAGSVTCSLRWIPSGVRRCKVVCRWTVITN